MTLTLEPETTPAAIVRPQLRLPGRTLRDGDHGRRTRRGYAIHAYVGKNGAGKTQWLVHDTLPDLDAGVPVLAAIGLWDARGDELRRYPNAQLATSYEQLLEFRDGVILLDEIVGFAGARESQSMPVQVQNWLVQLRRQNVVLRWSAPGWLRADKIIRETTTAVTVCTASLPVRAFDEHGRELSWAQNRFFTARTYDAAEFEEWSAAKREKIKPEATGRMWGPTARARYSYDTYAPVSRIALEIDGGRCASCGGYRARKKCTCDA